MTLLPSKLEDRLKQALAEHQLAEHYEAIRAVARLTFLLRVEPWDSASRPALGTSRLGGTPDLPEGWTWPVAEERRNYASTERRFLAFMGQINFAELPACGQPFPNHGILYVFASETDKRPYPHRLLYWPGGETPLVRCEAPDPTLFASEYDRIQGFLPVHKFIPSASLPNASPKTPSGDEIPDDEYWKLAYALHTDPEQHEPSSRLLGYPADDDCGNPLPRGWELLLCIQSFIVADIAPPMCFGDAGSLTFVAPTANLERGDFSTSQVADFSN